MRPHLVDKLSRETCTTCSHSSPEHGPYLVITAIIDKLGRPTPVVFCSACVATIMRPLEIVPRSELLKAHDELRREREFSASLSQVGAENEALRQRAETAESRIASLASENDSLKREREARVKGAARERQDALIATLQKPKSKRTKAAA